MSEDKAEQARRIVGWYTLAAAVKGAIPVPATSLAIAANNGFMIAHVAATMGQPVTWQTVVSSLGVGGTLNVAGRSIFIEAAKALAWGTGSAWAAVALSAVGATTAGVQTYIVGLLAIAIAKNGGEPISEAEAATVVEEAKNSYDDFVTEMKAKDLKDPGEPLSDVLTAVDVPRPSPVGETTASGPVADANRQDSYRSTGLDSRPPQS